MSDQSEHTPTTPGPKSHGCIWPVLAGGVVYFITAAIGLAITVTIVRQTPPEFSNPTEAYEGFGDMMTAVSSLAIGLVVSQAVAFGAGFCVTWGVSSYHANSTSDRDDRSEPRG